MKEEGKKRGGKIYWVAGRKGALKIVYSRLTTAEAKISLLEIVNTECRYFVQL